MARVLVIEDNSANLELMIYLLTAFGHQATAARDGEDGYRAAQLVRPDLILCDLQMPIMDGFAVAHKLKADPLLNQVPLVAVTAYAMVGDRDKVLAAGFNGYLSKPIEPETFVQQVEAFLTANQRTQPLAVSPAVGGQDHPQARATVLVVDDMQVNLELLQGILQPSGYAVEAAHTAKAALALARQQPPQLIITDLHMPGDDGLALLRAVKTDPALRHIPVIIHSASVATPQEHADVLALGAARYVARPIEPERLLEIVAACLREAPPR